MVLLCHTAQLQLVELFLRFGADPWVTTAQGNSGLHYVAMFGSMEKARLLIRTAQSRDATGAAPAAVAEPRHGARLSTKEGVNLANNNGDTGAWRLWRLCVVMGNAARVTSRTAGCVQR